jgi:hypothetical protein
VVEWLAPFGILAIGRFVESLRKGRVANAALGMQRLELRSPADAETVFARILQVGGGFRVDDSDPSKKILVLSSATTLWSSGFLFPVHVRQDIIGSIVVIGIRSKSITVGIVRKSRAHARCAVEIGELLGLPSARLVES